MSKVLVIVVTYNGMPWLDRCLSSVCVSTKNAQNVDVDLFVVDNDSTDGSADFVQAHFPQAKLVRSAENLGFSKANNLGMRYALDKGYDYVYLLNQDAWLAPGALETLVAAAEAHPEYAVLSPLQMTDGYKAMDPQFEKIFRRYAPQNDICHPGRSRRIYCVERVMAAHWLMPVAALKTVGFFEEELFPLYGQDDDWCNRARYKGLRIGIVAEARAVHDRAQRTESKEKVIRRNYYTGSLVRLCNPNRPLWERFCFVCLFTVVKAVKYGSFRPFRYFRQICRQLPAVRRHRAES